MREVHGRGFADHAPDVHPDLTLVIGPVHIDGELTITRPAPGIDGMIAFVDDHVSKLKRCLVQVKSGHVTSATMRDLIGTLDREKAEMGILVTLEPPTGPMCREAAEAGTYRSIRWGRDFPRVQILPITDLLAGQEPNVPPTQQTFARAGRIRSSDGHCHAGFLDPLSLKVTPARSSTPRP